MKLKVTILLFLIVVACLDIVAEELKKDSLNTFSLGEVVVMGHHPVLPDTEISSLKISKMDMVRVPEALEWLPGITLTEASSRNETMIYMRGFNQSRIPVYMDGIPVSVPFDGFIDLGRLQTAAVSKIHISKGISSLLLGGNTMGGAVNIISATPKDKFELRLQASTLWNSSVNVGTRRDKWYLQLDGGWIHRNDFRLPSKYHSENDLLEGRIRSFSQTRDYQLNGKFGFTPKSGDEYVVGYNLVRADKYVPPYLGTIGKPRFWRYKDWDKDQVFFLSKTSLNSEWTLESKLFYDRYYNLLKAYDDENYNSQELKSAFDSYYDDYSLGAGLIAGWDGLKDNHLRFGANYKKDVHRSHDNDDPMATQSEYTASFAVEDSWDVTDKLTLLAGAGYFSHKGIKIEAFEQQVESKDYAIVSYPTSSDDDINYQFEADYRADLQNSFRFSLSRNSRFASLKERYSYKLGRAVPNPDLKTEHSYNFDLTYNGKSGNLRWFGSVYYMILTNTIQEITGVVADDPLIWQLQNKGEAHFRGFEAGTSYRYGWLESELNYSYINRVNKTDKSVKFTEVPDHKLNAMVQVSPFYDVALQLRMTALSETNLSSDGKIIIPGYALFHLNISKEFHDFRLKIGVKNLFDKLYYFSEGYPMEGRRFYTSIAYGINK